MEMKVLGDQKYGSNKNEKNLTDGKKEEMEDRKRQETLGNGTGRKITILNKHERTLDNNLIMKL